MKSFIAHIIYRIECAGVDTEQYEEQCRLVYATDRNSALASAKSIAVDEDCVFVDRHGRTVQWKLLAVKDIHEVTLENGALLMSSVTEASPVTDPMWIE